MMVEHLPHISIEKYAAYLDCNLPDEEMQQMKAFIDNDADMQAVLETDSNIGGDLDLDLLENESVSFEMDLPSIELPTLDLYSTLEQNDIIDEIFSLDGDRFGENENLYYIESNFADELNETYEQLNSKDMETNYRTFGESGENLYDPVYIRQPDDHSCALRSQQIVLRDFGIDIPFKDLEKLAKDYGVYSDEGTYTYDIGKVLQIAGVDMHQVYGTSMFELTNELSQGHRVIVSVDARELWYNDSFTDKLKNWFDDTFKEQGGNHALIVAGVEINPQNIEDVKVVLTDPGAGHLRIEYPLDQFMNAWKDSNCFMAATNNPAPYQYDAETGKEVPSNFVVNQYVNDFVASHGYQLNPDLIYIPDNYQPAFTGHLTLMGNMDYSEFEEKYNDYLELRTPSELSIKEQIEEQAKSSEEDLDRDERESDDSSDEGNTDNQDSVLQDDEIEGDDENDEDGNNEESEGIDNEENDNSTQDDEDGDNEDDSYDNDDFN